MPSRFEMEQEAVTQQPLLSNSVRAGMDHMKLSLPSHSMQPATAREHQVTLRDLVLRAAKSRIIVIYILAVTVWFLGIFQFFKIPMAAEWALVLNYFLTMAYVAAMYHTGVLS